MNSKQLIIPEMVVLMPAMLAVFGCSKKTEPTPAPAMTTEQTAQATTAAVEQTICPVMGGKIDKDIFVEYQGKKVYFCCDGCKDEFLKAPQQYLPKLPQFGK